MNDPVVLPDVPSNQVLTWLEQARSFKKWPISRLITVFEATTLANLKQRHAVVKYLKGHFKETPAPVFGFTGTPGAGKSTLISSLTSTLLRKRPELTIAVIAVDPSSSESGGAILGDRTRLQKNLEEPRLFFRSQASNLELGGVSRKTFQATRLLRYLFDLVLVETVGIGQSEIEVQQVSDHAFLILQPLGGDEIQFMKCGIMEIPDTFIVNKCDEEELAKRSYHLLKSSLKLAKVSASDSPDIPIFLTSALKNRGVGEVADFVLKLSEEKATQELLQAKEVYYLKKWIREEYGHWGVSFYDEHVAPSFPHPNNLTYEEKELAFLKSVQARIDG